MVVFTVELKGLDCFRLQKDGRWRRISDDYDLLPSDFRTSEPFEVELKTPQELSIELDGATYKIDPTETSFSELDNILETSSRAFHKEYPNPPIFEQLRDIITCGNDSVTNILVLDVYSNFSLRQPSLYDSIEYDPIVIARYEAFGAGNGYVGQNAATENTLTEEIYHSFIEVWLQHLKTGELQQYINLPPTKSVAELRAELAEIEASWSPQV